MLEARFGKQYSLNSFFSLVTKVLGKTSRSFLIATFIIHVVTKYDIQNPRDKKLRNWTEEKTKFLWSLSNKLQFVTTEVWQIISLIEIPCCFQHGVYFRDI